jgi:hypothetical protein
VNNPLALASLVGVLSIAACGGLTGGGTGGTGGCATSLCGGVCCPTGESCVLDACCPDAQACESQCCAAGSACVLDPAGNQECAVVCLTSAACASAAPCCGPVQKNGVFSGHGVCQPEAAVGSYGCLCATSSECGANQACVPGINSAGFISGPYSCAAADADSHAGCPDDAPCSVADQLCATDDAGNDFCSTGCMSDSSCGNPGVACCNTSCAQGSCCGLCGG